MKTKKSYIFKGLDIVSCLLKMRALRDSFSANERRIADFIIENSQFMRDYSSQQLASAVSVSQSSIVKFSQKLGYKGYPDLKMAINESVVKELATHNLNTKEVNAETTENNTIHTLLKATEEAHTHCQTVNEDILFTIFAKHLLSANKVFIYSSHFGNQAANNLINRLLDKGIFARLIDSDSPTNLERLLQLGKQDVLLIIEDTDFSTSLMSTLTKVSQQGVVALLMNKLGDSKLHSITEQQLEWVVTSEEKLISQYQAESGLLSLVFGIELAISEQTI